jgi:hypothetical protein
LFVSQRQFRDYSVVAPWLLRTDNNETGSGWWVERRTNLRPMMSLVVVALVPSVVPVLWFAELFTFQSKTRRAGYRQMPLNTYEGEQVEL